MDILVRIDPPEWHSQLPTNTETVENLPPVSAPRFYRCCILVTRTFSSDMAPARTRHVRADELRRFPTIGTNRISRRMQ